VENKYGPFYKTIKNLFPAAAEERAFFSLKPLHKKAVFLFSKIYQNVIMKQANFLGRWKYEFFLSLFDDVQTS
jgi:hypothetical protein